MQHIFQNAKRLISMCLVTVLIVTSAITMLPAPARADNDLVIVKCESGVSDCGNMAAFAAGAVAGSVVTVVATGSSGGVTTAGMIAEIAAIGQAAITVAAPLVTAPALAAAAPVVVALAATAAVGYVGSRAWEAHQHSQAKSLN